MERLLCPAIIHEVHVLVYSEQAEHAQQLRARRENGSCIQLKEERGNLRF